MIPVRAVDDDFVRPRRCRGSCRSRSPSCGCRCWFLKCVESVASSAIGLKPRTSALFFELIEIRAGFREEALRRLGREPARDRQARRRIFARRQRILRPGPAVDDDIPRITRARRSRARSGTPPRPGARLPRICRSSGRSRSARLPLNSVSSWLPQPGSLTSTIDGLAFHVEAGVVVPVLLRRDDAVAGEHDRRSLRCRTSWLASSELTIMSVRYAKRSSPLSVATSSVTASGSLQRRLDHRHGLEPVAAVAGLEADLLELILDPGRRHALADRAGLAAFERVAGDLLDARGEILGGDRGRRMAFARSARPAPVSAARRAASRFAPAARVPACRRRRGSVRARRAERVADGAFGFRNRSRTILGTREFPAPLA